MKTPYKAKSLSGAQARVRRLEKALQDSEERVHLLHKQRVILAKLASEGPAFFKPRDLWDAEELRDDILRRYCQMNPDGTLIESEAK